MLSVLLMWADSKKHLRYSIADDVVAVIYNPIIKIINWPSKKVEALKKSFDTPEEIQKNMLHWSPKTEIYTYKLTNLNY